jgi:small subunit ribosomal protein S7
MFIAQGVHRSTFKSETDAAEALASQLTGAANNDVNTYGIEQKEEKERVAAAAR